MNLRNLAISIPLSAVLGAMLGAPALAGGGEGIDCNQAYLYDCPAPCTEVPGILFNCCSTEGGECCDRLCRQVACDHTEPHSCENSSGTNVAAGRIEEGYCQGGQYCVIQ